MAIGQDLLNVPMGEMIYSMASAIARSQLELDHASIESAEMMGGLKTIYRDDGTVGFTDSRVFFGHEYMTLAEAVVTQTDNAAVDQLVGSLNLKYDEYTPPAVADWDKTEATPSTNPKNIQVNAQNLALYQQNVQILRDRIAYLEGKVAIALAGADPLTSIQKSYQTTITALKAIEFTNKTSVSGILEHQVQVPTRVSLLELGFAPVFYAFVDTIIEVKISISITQENSSTTTTENTGRSVQGSVAFRGIPFLRGRMNRTREVSTSQVNATYSTRYSYTAEGSSLLRTKLSPVPTPVVLEERIRGMMAAEQARKAALLSLLTAAAAA